MITSSSATVKIELPVRRRDGPDAGLAGLPCESSWVSRLFPEGISCGRPREGEREEGREREGRMEAEGVS